MRSDTRWWGGPWPWLAYLVTYGIPWLWVPPSPHQLLLSASAIGVFLTVYFRSFHSTGKTLVRTQAFVRGLSLSFFTL